MSALGQVAGCAVRRFLLITAAVLALAGILTGCTETTSGTVTSVLTSDTPAAAPLTSSSPTAVAPSTGAPTSTACLLIYLDHHATINITGADAGGWCDRIRGADGHWMAAPSIPDLGPLQVDQLCAGSTDKGGYWVITDTGSDQYGKAGCVLVNQLGLRQAQEN